MTLEKINEMIDTALSEGESRPINNKTNILNAEYALGKYHGILRIAQELYGYNALVSIYDRTKDQVNKLMDIANTIYGDDLEAIPFM